MTEGMWFKGNLHSHTTVSDGKWTPEQAVGEFRRHGYSFLCLSDHNIYTDYRQKFNEDSFITLPGTEAAAVLYDASGNCVKTHHINGILGTSAMQKEAVKPLLQHGQLYGPFVYHGTWNGQKAAQDIIDDLHARGCIVTYNHPVWSRVEPEEVTGLSHIDMLEIYNYNTVNESGTGYDTTFWDNMLRSGRRQNADAADDNHNGGQFDDAFGGFIMVRAGELTQDAVITAILNGNYYSSSGPEIYDWEVTQNQVSVKCSPAQRVNFIMDGYVGAGTTVIAHGKQLLTECTAELHGPEHYVRIECMDEKGRVAWTNPLFTGK